MNDLLRFETRKLFRQKSLYICMLILAGIQILTGIVVGILIRRYGGTAEFGSVFVATSGQILNGRTMLQTAPSGSILNTLIIVATAIFVTTDYQTGTIKNIYGRGFGRGQVYFGKYLITVLCTLLMAGCTMLVSFIVGTAVGGLGSGYDATFVWHLLLQLFTLLAYITLAYMLITMIGKVGTSIAVCVAGPLVVEAVLVLIDMIPDFPISLNTYWLPNVLSEVMRGVPQGQDLARVLMTLVVYMVITLFLGWLSARRKEV